jgi:hypothetical protein
MKKLIYSLMFILFLFGCTDPPIRSSETLETESKAHIKPCNCEILKNDIIQRTKVIDIKSNTSREVLVKGKKYTGKVDVDVKQGKFALEVELPDLNNDERYWIKKQFIPTIDNELRIKLDRWCDIRSHYIEKIGNNIMSKLIIYLSKSKKMGTLILLLKNQVVIQFMKKKLLRTQ